VRWETVGPEAALREIDRASLAKTPHPQAT
jgi:hypothetical protein